MTQVLVLTGGRASIGPYGVDRLLDLGYQLVEVAPAENQLHRKVRDVFEHRGRRPVDKTIRSVRKAASADLVLAFLEKEALAASWLKARSVWPYAHKPLVMLSCWLADELRAMSPAERQTVVRQYRGVDLTLVWSRNQIDILVDAGFRPETVESISFGFAPGLFPLADPRKRTGVVAIGSDRGRDYGTLLDAVRGTGPRVDIYAGEGNLQGLQIPDEATFHGRVPYDEYRRLVATAAVVAVPTHEMAYPSGQTVALEAAATGACLLLTDTPAMREYFSDDTAVMLRPGDVAGWAYALRELGENDGLRLAMGERAARHVRSRFTYLKMWQQVDALLAARGWVV